MKLTNEQQAFRDAPGNFVACVACPGSGKEHPISQMIPTPDGWRAIGDLREGCSLFGRDGSVVAVTGVYPQGVKDVYRVTFQNGNTINCGLDHLWAVRRSTWQTKEFKALSLREILDQGISARGRRCNFWVPRAQAAQYGDRKYDLDPYFVGVMIGDGSYCGRAAQATLCAADSEAILNRIPCPISTREAQGCVEARFNVSLLKRLRAAGLTQKGPDKSIPPAYLIGSIRQRTELLRGLMDTDGSCLNNRTVFHTRAPQLARDVKQLVDSLGGYATIREYPRDDGIHKNKGGIDIEVRIQSDFCPFNLARKSDHWSPVKNGGRMGIVKVEKLGKEESVCISVSANDRLYLVGDYVVTHNTTSLLERAKRLAGEGKSVWIITYTNAVADEITERVKELEVPKGAIIQASTIHAFARHHIGRNVQVIDSRIVYGVMVDMLRPRLRRRYTSKEIQEARVAEKGPYHQPNELDAMWERIHSSLRRSRVIDYDGILLEFANNPIAGVDALLLDEAQDMGNLTWACFNRAIKPDGSRIEKTAVGDPNQAIFSFAGDGFELFQRFMMDADTVVNFTQNFRSRPAVVLAFNDAISENRVGHPAEAVRITGDPGSALFHEYDRNQEELAAMAAWLRDRDPGEAVVLCRTNAMVQNFREDLTAAGIPVIQEHVAKPRGWELMRAYLAARRDTENRIATIILLDRLEYNSGEILRMCEEVGRKPLLDLLIHPDLSLMDGFDKIRNFAGPIDPIMARMLGEYTTPSVSLALMNDEEADFPKEGTRHGVEVTTPHKAKGLEWDAVWIPGMDSRWSSFGHSVDRNEEIRCAYVAMSRARNSLVCSAVRDTEVMSLLSNR